MPKSIITARYRTTLPAAVREKLGVGPGDMLQWELMGDHVRVTACSRDFLDLRGSFKIGLGNPMEDIRGARELMGTAGD